MPDFRMKLEDDQWGKMIFGEKVISVSSESTDEQIPSAKAVNDKFNALLQTFYDAVHPINELVIGFAEPTVPAGVTATWTLQSAYDGKALWIDSTGTAGEELNGSLPNIKGKYQAYVAYCAGEGATIIKNGGTDCKKFTATETGTWYLDFDASRSNSIYSASAGANVVRPTSVIVKVWKRTA